MALDSDIRRQSLMGRFIIGLFLRLLSVSKARRSSFDGWHVAYLLTGVREIELTEPLPALTGWCGVGWPSGLSARRGLPRCRIQVARHPTSCPKLHGRYAKEIAHKTSRNWFAECPGRKLSDIRRALSIRPRVALQACRTMERFNDELVLWIRALTSELLGGFWSTLAHHQPKATLWPDSRFTAVTSCRTQSFKMSRP